MKKKLAWMLVFMMVAQIISPYAVQVSAAEKPQIITLSADTQPMVVSSEEKEEEVLEASATLGVKLNLAYEESVDSMIEKKISMEVYSYPDKTSVAGPFVLDRNELSKTGSYEYNSKKGSYSITAFNKDGVPLTNDKMVSFMKLELSNLPLGEYYVKFTGLGYTTYESKPAKIETYSQEVVISTDDGRFMIGDTNQDNRVDETDRKLVEENFTDNYVKNSQYELDFNRDRKIDIVDLAMVNRHIDVPKMAADNFETAVILDNKVLQLDAMKTEMKTNQEYVSVEGSMASLFQEDQKAVTFTSEKPISEEKPVVLPIMFEDTKPVTMSEVVITTPETCTIEGGRVLVEVEGQTEPLQLTIDNPKPEQAHALTTDPANRNTVVINLGKKVPVKKITISVTKVALAEGGDAKYVSMEKIDFIKDIVPDIPKSDNGVVKEIKVTPKSKQLQLNWKRVANIEGYYVYISNKASSDLSDYKRAETVDTTTATVKNYNGKELENFTTYYVIVTSYNGEWESGVSEYVAGIPLPDSKPLPPDNLFVEEGDKSLTLSWKKTKDATSYHVYYKPSKEGGKYIRATASPITSISYAITGLTNKVQYDMYVTALNDYGESNPSIIATGMPAEEEIKDPGIPSYNRIEASEITEIRLGNPQNVDTSSAGKFPESIVDGDFKTHWTSISWQKDTGLIYTFKEPHTMDFVTFVPRLDGQFKNSMGYYTIQVWGENDDLKKDVEPLVKHKGIKTLTSKEEGNKGKYAILTFPKTKVKQIKVTCQIWNGAPTNISISEMVFYDYYSLMDDIRALFADDTYTSLAEGVTKDKINNLKAALNDAERYYVDSAILSGELDLAESLLPDNTSKVGRIVNAKSMNGFQPLGVSAVTGEDVIIYASIPEGETVKIVPTQYFAEASAWRGEEISLQQGRNVLTMPKIHSLKDQNGGSLYMLYNREKANEIKLHINYYGGKQVTNIKELKVRWIPVLELYNWESMSESDRKNEIKRYITELSAYCKNIYPTTTDVKNATEISLPGVLLSIPASKAKEGIVTAANYTEDLQVDSVYQNVLAWKEFMHIMHTTHGTNEADMAKQTRENIRYMRMFGNAFMYAAGSHIGVGYGSTTPLMMGQPAAKTGVGNANHLFGWGIAHEVGHNKDTLGHAEITNNIYALFGQAYDGGKGTLTTRIPYEEVFAKTASSVQGFSNNGAVQLGMYWQLHLAYDGEYKTQEDNFYYKLNKKLLAGEYSSYPIDERFAILASQTAGYDLSEYFAHWGLKLSTDAQGEMKKGTNGAEPRAIYYLDDDSRMYRMNQGADLSALKLSAQSVYISTDGMAHPVAEQAYPITEEIANQLDGSAGVQVTWEVPEGTNVSALQGFEISRSGKSVAFVRADQRMYLDKMGSANNRAYTYSVRPITKLGTKLEAADAGEVRISHDVVIDRKEWTWKKVDSKEGNAYEITFVDGKAHSASGIRISPFTASVPTPDPSEPTTASTEAGNSPTTSTLTTETPTASTEAAEPTTASTEAVEPTTASTEAAKQTTTNTGTTEPTTANPKAAEAASAASYQVVSSDIESSKSLLRTISVSTGSSIRIDAVVEVEGQSESVLVKEVDFAKNETTEPNKYLTYFNKPNTGNTDTRIWTYDAKSFTITGLPDSISMDQVDLIEYPGDNIEITEGYIGLLGADYTYATSDGTETIPAGTLVIAGNYRGDPVYNYIKLRGKYMVNSDTLDGSQKAEERDMDGYSLLFAEIPEDGAVSEISDGFFLFVPNIQKELELQNKEISSCGNSVLPAEMKAQLYRSNSPDSTSNSRLTSDTLWTIAPSYETMPRIILKQGTGE